jgi:hypothetical protein
MIYDAIRIWPVNFLRKLEWKLFVVTVFVPIVWILVRLSIWSPVYPNDVIPFSLVITWIIACFARISELIVHRGIPFALSACMYIGTLIITSVMWSFSETMLKGCGAKPDKLSGYESLALGINLPVTEVLVALIAGIAEMLWALILSAR